MHNEISQEYSHLSAAKRVLLEKRLRGKLFKKVDIQPIPRRTKFGPGSLSFAQQRLWFLEQFEDRMPTYNVPFQARLTGPLNVSILEQALNEIVRRHEILRTSFTDVDGQPIEVVTPRLTVTLPVKDLRNLLENERKAKAQQLACDNTRQLFDLTQCPLFRFLLLQLDEEDYIILITIHHIIYDGWSNEVFMKELTTLYEAFSVGKPSPLPEIPIQYADFAQWQRNRLRGETLTRLLSYWKHKLSGSLPFLELPTDRLRPARQTFQGIVRSFALSKTLSDTLKTLSQREQCTLFMTLLAAFKILLYRYTGQEDIIVGSPIANRNRTEIEGLIGFFVNTLVLRTDLSGNPTFRELLSKVRKITLEAQIHQDMPFDLLVEELQPKRDMSHHPLFQIMFVLQDFELQSFTFSGVTLQQIEIHTGTSMFDLTFEMMDTDQGLRGYVEYNTDLFDATTISRMTEHFKALLEGIVADPEQRISELPILTATEQQQILLEWNDTNAEYSKNLCIHELFEEQVKQTPDAVAIVFGDAQLTYRELNQRANQLAHYLRKFGVGPEVPVGICIERSLNMVVGLLGILKAGGAYVPLDRAYPKERLAFMLKDTRTSVLLTQQSLLNKFSEHGIHKVCLDVDWNSIDQESGENPVSGVTAENLVYIIYTSGATGKPKGVMIQHKSLVNYTETASRIFKLNSEDRILQFASISFDASAEEIYPCLTRGATLVLRTDSMLNSVSFFLEKCREFELTVLDLPTAFWHQLTSELSLKKLRIPDQVRLVIIGGERAIPERLIAWQNHVGSHVQLINTYGPTETTIVAIICEISTLHIDSRSSKVPIGHPICNVQSYILDRHLNLVPVNVPGELCIGGVGLARGYLNRPDLTAENFIFNPFNNEPSERLYRTGDLARYLPDGNIEFLGRIDYQVKIRGFRIELGEIETILREHPVVHEVVVIARENESGDKRLAAYIVLHRAQAVTVSELRDFLKKQLPDYMIPATFTFLDALPLTPNGKVDRRALPEPDMTRPELSEAFVAPRTPAEKTMAAIWSGLLHIDQIGVHDDFFELGGHSLLAVQLVAEVEKLFQVKIPLWKLFDSPTIAGLAQAMKAKQWQGAPTAVLDVPVIDGHAEATLDDTIRPHNVAPPCSVTDYEHIFLTGATGFLGAFLLYELLRQTRADIYCLVRSIDLEEGKKLIRSNLERYFLWSEYLSPRIIPVPGDLSQPRLGLTSDQFERLAQRIDVIYHGGAMVNLLYPYSALKPTNVLGTQEILRLASLLKLKPVHYVSTVAVFPFVDRDRTESITEDTPLEHFDALKFGYSQSKWVAEKLIATAHVHGIPCTVYRPSRIAGHSQTGIWNTNDFACRMIKGCIQMGIVPQQPITEENWAPVDYVSRAIVRLSQQKTSWGQAFHLINRQPIDWNDLVDWICAFGYSLRKLSYERWRKEFCERTAENALSPLMPLFREPDALAEPQHFSCRNTLAGLEGSSITCPPVEAALLYTYFAYFIRSGFLEPPS